MSTGIFRTKVPSAANRSMRVPSFGLPSTRMDPSETKVAVPSGDRCPAEHARCACCRECTHAPGACTTARKFGGGGAQIALDGLHQPVDGQGRTDKSGQKRANSCVELSPEWRSPSLDASRVTPLLLVLSTTSDDGGHGSVHACDRARALSCASLRLQRHGESQESGGGRRRQEEARRRHGIMIETNLMCPMKRTCAARAARTSAPSAARVMSTCQRKTQ